MISSLKFIKKIHSQIILISCFTLLSFVAQAKRCESTYQTNIPNVVKMGLTPADLDKYSAVVNITGPTDKNPGPPNYYLNVTHDCRKYSHEQAIALRLIPYVSYDGKKVQDYYKDTPTNLLEVRMEEILKFRFENKVEHKDVQVWPIFSEDRYKDYIVTHSTTIPFGYASGFTLQHNFTISNNFHSMSIVIIKPPQAMIRKLAIGGVQYGFNNRPELNDATLHITINLPIASDPNQCSAKLFKVTAPDTVNFGAIRRSEILNNPNYRVSRDFDISIHKANTQTEKCTQNITPKIYFDTSEKLTSSYTTAELKNGLALKIKDKKTGKYVNLNNEEGISGPEILGKQEMATVKASFTAELTKAASAKEIATGEFNTTLKYIIEFP